MKLTLRKARKLESKIQNMIDANNGIRPVAVDPYSEIASNPDMMKTRIEIDQEANMEGLTNSLLLMKLRTEIRDAIRISNEESGINGVISARKFTNGTLKLLTNILDLSEHTEQKDTHSLVERFKKMREKESVYGMDVSIPMLREEDINKLTDNVRELQNKVDQMDDELLSLNTSTYIHLSDEQVALLKENKIL